MERRISFFEGGVVALLAVVINLCYHLGVVSTLKFCAVACLYFLNATFFAVATLSLVVSVSMATSCFVIEVLEGYDSQERRYHPLGALLWSSFLVSVIATTVGFFVGNTYAVLFTHAGESFFLKEILGVSFPAAEFFRFETLFPVFWKPYLAAYIISLILALVLWCDRKHCAFKRKKGKKTKVVVRW